MDFSYGKVMEWFDMFVDIVATNRKQFLMGVSGIAMLAVAGVGYMYYSEWMQARAHKDFINALRYYDATVGGKTRITDDVVEFASEDEKWKKVEEVLADAYKKNRSSGIGGVLRAYQANAIASQGRVDEAIDMLSLALSSISSKEVKDFYALKLALMKLDSTNTLVQTAGLEELKKIAENQNHYAHELALFYIGYYFWTQKDFAAVKNYWQQFMVKYGLKDMKQQSGCAEIVRAKLKLISADW